MKRLLVCLVAIVLMVPVFSSAQSVEPIRIGVFEPLSGANEEGGAMEDEGIRVAHSMFPEVLGRPVELVVMDNKSADPTAIEAARALVEADVAVVLGSWGSSFSMVGQPIFEAAEIPAIGISCTNPQVTQGNEYYFRVCYIDPFQGRILAEYAEDTLGGERAAILCDISSAYAIGLRKYFEDAYGLDKVVAEGYFSAGETQFEETIEAVMATSPDFIFIPASYTESAYIMAQARALGYDEIQFLGADVWETNDLIAIGGEAVEGCMFTTFYDIHGDETEQSAAFLRTYDELFTGVPRGATTPLGYDAYMAAIKAIEAAGSTEGPAVRDALQALSFEGITGPISFDENGDALVERAIIMTVRDGKFTYLDTVILAE